MTKVLIIEDELMVRENLLDLLTAEGFETAFAENGRRGVELAPSYKPDLIICDIKMPELDGYGVLSALRRNPLTSTIPFIFLTANADLDSLRQGMVLGADDYLTKPFSRVGLLQAIAIRLEKQAAIIKQYSSEIKQIQEKLDYLLHYDSLTALPNRVSLLHYFNQAVLDARSQFLPLILLSLDRFERINETLGHSVGELLLRAVADRLKTHLPERDTLAWLQAGQFAMILPGLAKTETPEIIAQTLLESIAQPFKIDDRELFMTASLGIAFYPGDGTDLDRLVRSAESALLQARRMGGNHYQFYQPNLDNSSEDELSLETDLRYALERNELKLFYQPQVDLQSGRIVGAEALLRWQHPKRGLVSPAQFIPLAEQSGLIVSIGEWVLQTACAQTKSWQLTGPADFRIAVNLSARQFNRPNLLYMITRILKETELAPNLLELELTESTLVENVDQSLITMKALKKLGVQISIDDFGTGYSSLSYLKQFPFDTLKIDQFFVHNIEMNSANSAITQAIIQMARNMGLRTVAEGVETPIELDFLRQHKCDEIQGYYFSRPVPATEFEQLVAAGKTL